MTSGKKYIMPEADEKWLVRHYKHTANGEICEKLGICPSTMHRLARRLHLTKSRQFMLKVAAANSEKARIVNKAKGWPPKGYQIPNREQAGFKAGVTNRERMGAKREALRVERSKASIAQVRREEHARVTFNLPQKTKLRIKKQSRVASYRRWYLKKLGYHTDSLTRVAYYDGDTRRNEAREALYTKPPFAFTFIEL